MPKKSKIWSSDKADLEFSHFIRDRDGGRCFFCGKQGSQNSHFWGRGKSALRYDPRNCDYVCGGCHMRHEGNKHELYMEMKKKQLGKKVYNEMRTIYYQSQMTRREAIIKCMEMIKAPSVGLTKEAVDTEGLLTLNNV